MKQTTVEVRSNKVKLGEIDVPTFESLTEAVAFFQKEAGAEAKEDAGEQAALALLNSQYKSNLSNAFRVSKTRTKSSISLLREAAKSNPNAKAKIQDLLKDLGYDVDELD